MTCNGLTCNGLTALWGEMNLGEPLNYHGARMRLRNRFFEIIIFRFLGSIQTQIEKSTVSRDTLLLMVV